MSKDHETVLELRKALIKLKEYKNEKLINESKKGLWENDIANLIQDLVKESFALGASGELCDCCKGSGRK